MIEPRQHDEYSDRQVEAARRVLVDIGQILASFRECMVIVGGWTPDLLITNPSEAHVGSTDVDIALDAHKLVDGRYAELLNQLLKTKRYRLGDKSFQLVVNVDLEDGEASVQVEVEFLSPTDVTLDKNAPKLLPGFRILQVEACSEAFESPVEITIPGHTVRGAENTVRMRVASIADFLIMKAHAIAGRDKPKDSYDFCYCLEQDPMGLDHLADKWRERITTPNVVTAIEILREKFASEKAFGPQQVVEFYNDPMQENRAIQARRAFELVNKFLGSL